MPLSLMLPWATFELHSVRAFLVFNKLRNLPVSWLGQTLQGCKEKTNSKKDPTSFQTRQSI